MARRVSKGRKGVRRPRTVTVTMTAEEHEAFVVARRAEALERLEGQLKPGKTIKYIVAALEEALPTLRTVAQLDGKAKVPCYIFR